MSAAWKLAAATALLAVGLVALLRPAPSRPMTSWVDEAYRDEPVLLAAYKEREARRIEMYAIDWAWRSTDTRERAHAAVIGAGPGLTLRLSRDLPEGLRRSVERSVRDELAALGRDTPRHPVVVLAFVDPASRSGQYERAIVLSADPSSPCVVVIRFSPVGLAVADIPVTDRVLGTCAFYAAFSAPGTGMVAWLRATNMATAGYLTPPAAIAGDTARIRLVGSFWAHPYDLRACVSGRAQGCDRVFTPDSAVAADARAVVEQRPIPRLVDTDDVAIYSRTSLTSENARVSDGLLAALATAMGPDRFAAVWRSARSPEAEYALQAGRPLSAWLHAYVSAQTEPYRAGPSVPPLQASLALVLILAATSAAIGWAPRRVS